MEKKVLFKKEYTIDDNNEYIYVKEFLILEDDNGRELVLKLVNATNETCHDIKYVVTQLNAKGEEITKSTFESRKMKRNAYSEFVPNKAMTVDSLCEDVIVELIFASFDTAYYVKGELNPITPNMRKEVSSKDGIRQVKNKSFAAAARRRCRRRRRRRPASRARRCSARRRSRVPARAFPGEELAGGGGGSRRGSAGRSGSRRSKFP